jgi:hypothetical protein
MAGTAEKLLDEVGRLGPKAAAERLIVAQKDRAGSVVRRPGTALGGVGEAHR